MLILVPVWVCDPWQPPPRGVFTVNDFVLEAPEDRSVETSLQLMCTVQVGLPQRLTEFVTERISQAPL